MTQLAIAASNYPGIDPMVRQLLEAKFDSSLIKSDVRRSTDNWEPVYVEAVNVIKRLNDVFHSAWSFEIMREQFVPHATPVQIVVLGRLSVGCWVPNAVGQYEWGTITKMQYGSCWIKKNHSNLFLDLGADFKSAATDSLKKCATMFGIALELYERDENMMQGLSRVGSEGQQGNFPAQQVNPNAQAEPWQFTAVDKAFANLGANTAVWMQTLQIQNQQQLTQGMVQQVLSGNHPYIQWLHQQTNTRPGLAVSSA